MKSTNPSPTTATKLRALIVPADVLALEGITLTAKLILAEVIDLYKVKKHVFASDEHFAARLGIGLRTVGDAIKQLHEHGLLARTVDPKARHKRQLTPTLPSNITANQSTKSLRNSPASDAPVAANSAAGAREIRNDSLRNLPEVPAKSADINTRVNTTSITSSISGQVTARAATCPPEKKLDEEKGDNSVLTAALSSPLVAALPPSSPANPADVQRPTQALLARLCFPKAATEQFREAFTLWVSFRQQRGRPLTAASFQLQLDELAQYHEEFSLPLISTAIKNGSQGLTYPETKRKYTYWLTSRHASGSSATSRSITIQQRQQAPSNVSYGSL